MRFLMLKRFMDVFYASVGTAMESIDQPELSRWQLPIATAAAASFYSLTGARKKASQAVNSASHDLIRNAWWVQQDIFIISSQLLRLLIHTFFCF
jgi:hypothetical protein